MYNFGFIKTVSLGIVLLSLSNCEIKSTHYQASESEQGCDIYTEKCVRPKLGSTILGVSGRSGSRRGSGSLNNNDPNISILSNLGNEVRKYLCTEYERMFKEIREKTDFDKHTNLQDVQDECIYYENRGQILLCPIFREVRGCLEVRRVDNPRTSENEAQQFDIVCINDEARSSLNNDPFSTEQRVRMINRLLGRLERRIEAKLIWCVYSESPDCLEPTEINALEVNISHIGSFREFGIRKHVDEFARKIECENRLETDCPSGINLKSESEALEANEVDRIIEEAHESVSTEINGYFQKPYGESCPE